MIEFADRAMAVRFIAVHRQLKQVLREFAAWSRREKLPSPVVTGLDRAPEFYSQNKLKQPRFSWHYPCPTVFADSQTFTICAVDLRNRHYTPEQEERVAAWFRERCCGSEWELITVDHGTGPHVHVAYRDFLLRRAWEQMNKEPQ